MIWDHDNWKDAVNSQNTQMARERGIETETDELGNVRFKRKDGKLVPRDRSDDWGCYVDSQGRVRGFDD